MIGRHNIRYMEENPVNERDENKTQAEQGVYRKFDVFRTDCRDMPGGDRQEAEYFVLDLTYDPHAKAALAAYAESVAATHPELARDLRAKLVETPA